MTTITIPRGITKNKELVAIPRKEYERLLALEKKETVTAEDVLRWSREARALKKNGKLVSFRGFLKKEYPFVAKKFNIR